MLRTSTTAMDPTYVIRHSNGNPWPCFNFKRKLNERGCVSMQPEWGEDYQQLSAWAVPFSPAVKVDPDVFVLPPFSEEAASVPNGDRVIVDHREGFERVSRRVFVAPAETPPSLVIDELNSVHSLGLHEKNCIRLEADAWGDTIDGSRDEAFEASVNRTFRVKGGKPGPRFWKGVREAVMKQCGTQDMVLLVPACPSGPSAGCVRIVIEQVIEHPLFLWRRGHGGVESQWRLCDAPRFSCPSSLEEL